MKFENKQKISVNRRLFYFLIFLTLSIPALLGLLISRFFCDRLANGSKIILSTRPTPVGKGLTGFSSIARPSTTLDSETVWHSPRLPPHIVPLHYSMTLYPVFAGNDSMFYGNESVILLVYNATRYILLHSKGLNVTFVRLYANSTGQNIEVKKCFLFSPYDYWVVETVNEIPDNWFVNLTIRFQGVLTNQERGFFKKTYTDSLTGTTRFLASTDFEPTYARRAFPCLDEPHLKAEFSINVIHKPVYVALSNMPNQSSFPVEWGSDLIQTRFQRSVRMSTFAVSFIVCDLQLKRSDTIDGKILRVFSTPDKINQTNYALHLLNTTLAFYTKILNTSYPLPKLDLIAMPSRLSKNIAGWGLISFPDSSLLYDEAQLSSSSSAGQKILVARGIAHGVAHMWFGNLLTMKWWNDLWFKEGIVSFLETITCARMEPDIQELHISMLSTQEAMAKDADPKIKPIMMPVSTQNEIEAVFGEVTFKKGAAIFHMLQNLIGEEDFYESIRLFLRRFQWGTAITADLWQAFNDVVRSIDVKEIMEPWVSQPGFPIINVNYDHSDPVDPRLDIRQSRFRSDFIRDTNDTQDSSQNIQYKWFVALDYITSLSKILNVHWMNKTNSQIQLKHPLPSWIKFNVNRSGYYRVNYPLEIWQYFSENFQRGNFQELSPLDRSGLLDDAIALASSGYLDYNVALNMTLYLDKEHDYVPWKMILNLLYQTNQRLRSDKAYSPWRKYVLSKITPILDTLGWETTQGTISEQLLRNLLINVACKYEAEPCLQMASEKFKDWIKTNKSIESDLKNVVYQYGMSHSGTAEDWDIMWERYIRDVSTQEQKLMLFGLSQTKSDWLLQRKRIISLKINGLKDLFTIYSLLKHLYYYYNKLVKYIWFALDQNKVKPEAFIDVMEAVSFNPVGNCVAWEWLRENLQYVMQRFSQSKVEFLIYRITKSFNTEFQLNQILEIFQKFPDSEDSQNHQSLAIQEVKNNIFWMKASKPKVVAWLNKFHN